MNVRFSVARCVCEFTVLQFLALAEAVAVCAESCVRAYVAQNYILGLWIET